MTTARTCIRAAPTSRPALIALERAFDGTSARCAPFEWAKHHRPRASPQAVNPRNQSLAGSNCRRWQFAPRVSSSGTHTVPFAWGLRPPPYPANKTHQRTTPPAWSGAAVFGANCDSYAVRDVHRWGGVSRIDPDAPAQRIAAERPEVFGLRTWPAPSRKRTLAPTSGLPPRPD